LTSSSTTTTPQDQKILVKHKLSKELQLYYEKITESIIGPDDSVRDVALASIRKDPSIQPLLPYFVQYITEHVYSILFFFLFLNDLHLSYVSFT